MSSALQYFKALSDRTRLRLTRVLQRYELSVNELVQLLGMGQSRISRHLKILADAGLLNWRRDGLWVFYRAAESGPGKAFLAAMAPFAEEDAAARNDVDMAARIIEDRARNTRLFFNAIAEDWDALNREVLGDFDLAGAVCAELPVNCGVAADLGCGTGMVLERMRFHVRERIGVDGSPRMLELARRRLAAAGGHDG
ncbi:MAG: metalloregulator ArsR/SmtB family transcription factor, partial [Desulfovibrionaceae bacterium]|nr:metalloregulator ArsR/SmtB family transcription factor [Desulfovibrionaceae bacterium]